MPPKPVLSATACAKARYDGFGCQFAQRRPDCQPPRPRSSASRKLKNAPTYGWQ
jgi:hypothetical protein